MLFALLTYIYLQHFQVRGTTGDVRTPCNRSHLPSWPQTFLDGSTTAMSVAPPYLAGQDDGPVAQQGCSMTDEVLRKGSSWVLPNTVTCWFMNTHSHSPFTSCQFGHLSRGKEKKKRELKPLTIHNSANTQSPTSVKSGRMKFVNH